MVAAVFRKVCDVIHAVDSQAALALEAALRDMAAGSESNGKTMATDKRQQP